MEVSNSANWQCSPAYEENRWVCCFEFLTTRCHSRDITNASLNETRWSDTSSSIALDVFVAPACIITVCHKPLAVFICEIWSFPRRETGSVCSQTHHFPWHAMFWLMAPHYQRSRDATLDVYKLLSLEVDGARTEAGRVWEGNSLAVRVRQQWLVSPRRAVQSSGKLTNTPTAATWHEPDENSSSLPSLYFSLHPESLCQTAGALDLWISSHLYSHHFGV